MPPPDPSLGSRFSALDDVFHLDVENLLKTNTDLATIITQDNTFAETLTRLSADDRFAQLLNILCEASNEQKTVCTSQGVYSRPRPRVRSLPRSLTPILQYPWEHTSLGAIHQWPSHRLAFVDTCMSSPVPICMFLGQDMTLIYNEAMLPIFKRTTFEHSRFGKDVPDPAFWPSIAKSIEHVYSTGESVSLTDIRVISMRQGWPEEVYFSWKISPKRDSYGNVDGAFATVEEKTQQIIFARRLNVLKAIGHAPMRSQTCCIKNVCELATTLHATDPLDVSFSMVYLYDENARNTSNRDKLNLISSWNLPEGHAAAPLIVSDLLDEARESPWPIAEAVSSKSLVLVDNVSSLFNHMPGGAWSESCQQAVLVPLFCVSDAWAVLEENLKSPSSLPAKCGEDKNREVVGGVLIVGLSPRLRYDGDYKEWLESLGNKLESLVSKAYAFEATRQCITALKEIDKAKTSFFSNVSHEFRTPLTLISGPIEDMLADRDKALTGDQRARAQLVQRNAYRLRKLVNSLLDFSRLEGGRLQASYEATDLALFTADLASMFRAAMEKAGLQFNVQCPPLRSWVRVDRGILEKIVLNLLSNALKYTFKGSVSIRIHEIHANNDTTLASTSASSSFIELEVQDTGVGIPEEALPRVFERFYRVEGSVGRSIEGSGIGLALVQELAKLHGGYVSVSSTYGLGSTFRVRLPFLQADPDTDIESSQQAYLILKERANSLVREALSWLQDSPPPSPIPQFLINNSALGMSSPKLGLNRSQTLSSPVFHILLVDDNADIREYVSKLLSRAHNWKVSVVNDGQQAWEAIVNGLPTLPDLVLSDVMMPNLDGYGLLRNIRGDHRTEHLPVILLSADAGSESVTKGISAGADDYLVKPFSAPELLARVNTHLELGRLRSNLEREVQERTQEVQASETKYRQLAMHSLVGVVQLGPSAEILYCNERYLEIIGRERADLEEDPLPRIVHPDDQDAAKDSLAKIFSTGQPFRSERRYLRPDGSTTYALVQGAPVYADGKVTSCVVSVTDLTEQRISEQEKIKAMQCAEAIMRKRVQDAETHKRKLEFFIDNVCHNFLNPLNGIVNNTDILQTNLRKRRAMAVDDTTDLRAAVQEQDEVDQEAIDAIVVCAGYQKKLAKDVLLLSRLESGGVESNQVPFDPVKIILSAAQMYIADMTNNGISFRFHRSEDGHPVHVQGDPDQLYIIILNLVSNAVKFTKTATREPKQVEVTLKYEPVHSESSDRKVEMIMMVHDNGVGITQEAQKYLFDKFGGSEVRRKFLEYEGSGLGLFITNTLVQLLGGTIHVASVPDHGSTFTVTIPFEVATDSAQIGMLPSKRSPVLALGVPNMSLSDLPDQALTPPTEASHVEDGPRHILIVEDNVVNQKVLKRHLEMAGHSCKIAGNGQIALDTLVQEGFDLVFMDLEMPVMGGLEATRRIRANGTPRSSGGAPVPIVALSGNARQEYIDEALACGMQQFIVKPYRKEDLLAVIQKWTRA